MLIEKKTKDGRYLVSIEGTEAEILDIRAKEKRRGHGRDLVDDIFKECRDHGVNEVWGIPRRGSVRFWEAMGFTCERVSEHERRCRRRLR